MKTFNYFESYGPGEKLKGNKTRISYYQTGGAVNEAANAESDEDQMRQQIVALVQAAMQGDQKAQQQIQQIMQAAQSGDQQAQAIAQVIQQVVQQMQGQAREAKYGAKLNYIHRLRTGVNRNERVCYQKCGGKVKKSVTKVKKAQPGSVLTPPPGYQNYLPEHVVGKPHFSKSNFYVGNRSTSNVPEEFLKTYYWAKNLIGSATAERIFLIEDSIKSDINLVNEIRNGSDNLDPNVDRKYMEDQLMRRIRYNLASLYLISQRTPFKTDSDMVKQLYHGIDAFVQGLSFVDINEIMPTKDDINEVGGDISDGSREIPEPLPYVPTYPIETTPPPSREKPQPVVPRQPIIIPPQPVPVYDTTRYEIPVYDTTRYEIPVYDTTRYEIPVYDTTSHQGFDNSGISISSGNSNVGRKQKNNSKYKNSDVYIIH